MVWLFRDRNSVSHAHRERHLYQIIFCFVLILCLLIIRVDVADFTAYGRWNAILLLDEADVFLEKRELNSLKRNELVSIFLRLLEYYEGMMFLTTNRVSTIDPAFESRIDVSIDYPNLTPDLRLQIWENFLYRDEAAKAAIGREDLVPIAELALNGRQIKSAVKTAQLLAMSKEEGLKVEHLRKVLRLHRMEA